jgi:hypothetical protein
MTELEAKSTWCPMARVTKDEGRHEGSFNRTVLRDGYVVASGGSANCIAARCQLWVWDMASMEMLFDDKGPYFRAYDGQMPQGHCGLRKP